MPRVIFTKKNSNRLKTFLKTQKFTKYKWQGRSNGAIYVSKNNRYLFKTNVPDTEIENIITLNSKLSKKYKPYFLLDYTVYTINKIKCLKMKYYPVDTLKYKSLHTFRRDELIFILNTICNIIIHMNYDLKLYFNDLHLNNILYLPNTKYKIKLIDFEQINIVKRKYNMVENRYSSKCIKNMRTECIRFLSLFFSRLPDSNKNDKINKERNKKVQTHFYNVFKKNNLLCVSSYDSDMFLKKYVIQNINTLLKI